ncbi:hypothetical protein MOVI109754_01785 [Moritella viscosa]|nr:Putative uncharacterized protein [Moritella viscosa]SHO04230.1 Putative uncharacterized protein [Moritella viscosa]
MNGLINRINQLIIENRSEWIGLITYGYGIDSNDAIKYYGYTSIEDYSQDLIKYFSNKQH